VIFQKDKITIIKGKSGIGKTTLLKVLGLISWNIHKNSRIVLSINGTKKSITELSLREKQKLRKKHFGFIFQDDHLIDSLNVLNNILFPSLLNIKAKAKESPRTRLRVLAERLEKYLAYEFLKPIKDKLGQSCSVLSGGEKKKVALLRAILKDPDILIADEPWTNMGKKDVEAYTRFFVEQRKNRTTILATHDDKSIKKYIDKYPDITEFFEIQEKTGKNQNIKILCIEERKPEYK
jgi:ABC-type lipoprotein export system ATPase subunit